jgi:hypothetical protein
VVDHDNLKHLIFEHLLLGGVLLSFHTDQATVVNDPNKKLEPGHDNWTVFSYDLRTLELEHNGLGVTSLQKYQSQDLLVHVPWKVVVSIAAHHFFCNWQFVEVQQTKATTKPQLRLV